MGRAAILGFASQRAETTRVPGDVEAGTRLCPTSASFMGLLPFELLPFRRLRGVQTVIQNQVPVKTGDSGAFSAATARPPLNPGRCPGVAYDLSGRSLLDKSGQVLNTTEQILALPTTTQDRLTPPRVARLTLSLAMLPFAKSEACGQLASGFVREKNKSTISSTTRTATTCCSSNTSTQPRKLSKVEIHASLRLLLIL